MYMEPILEALGAVRPVTAGSCLCTLCYAQLISPREIGLTEHDCELRMERFSRTIRQILAIESGNPGFLEKRVLATIRNNLRARQDYELLLQAYLK